MYYLNVFFVLIYAGKLKKQVPMLRKIVLFLMVFTLSFQSLGAALSPEKTHDSHSIWHDALHFWAEPHSHDTADPTQILLEFSAEARNHVAPDMDGSVAALLQHSILKKSLVQTTPDISCVQCLPEPYLHRVTPPPRA
jgi:hypothetical protein